MVPRIQEQELVNSQQRKIQTSRTSFLRSYSKMFEGIKVKLMSVSTEDVQQSSMNIQSLCNSTHMFVRPFRGTHM